MEEPTTALSLEVNVYVNVNTAIAEMSAVYIQEMSG